MSTTLSMLRRGALATLLVHVAQTMGAWLLFVPVHAELAQALAEGALASPFDPTDLGLLVGMGMRHLSSLGPWMLGCLLVYALIAPGICVAWVHALIHGSLRPALGTGVRCAAQALTLRVLCMAVLATTTTGGLLLLAASIQRGGADLETTMRVSMSCALFLCAWLVSTVHDLGLAAIAVHGAGLRAAIATAITRTTLRRLLAHAGAVAAASALIMLADLFARADLGLPGPWGPSLATAVGQILLFASLNARALWLTTAARAASTPVATQLSPPRS